MRSFIRFAVLFTSLVCLAACAAKAPVPAKPRVITGEVVYRERLALPPSAVAMITLLETRPGQEPVAVSTLRVESAGRSVPLPFTLNLDGNLPPKAVYALTASIEVDGVPFFRTPSPVAVSLATTDKPFVLLTHRVFVDPTRPEQSGNTRAAGEAGRLGRLGPAVPLVFASAPAATGKITLLLDADQVYRLRHESATGLREESGRWHQLRDGSVQLATQGREARLLTVEGKSLVLREAAGKKGQAATSTRLDLLPAPSGQNEVQNRNDTASTRQMTGLYRQQGETATFRDCDTQALYTAREGAGLQLLREVYLSKARSTGETLLAKVEGLTRESTEPGSLPELRVERFLTLGAGQCQPLDDTPPAMLLGGARWKLLEAFGEPVRVVDDREEPHLVFEPSAPDQGAVFGSDGCNRFRGSYGLQGDQLRFSHMASTLMLCQELGAQPQTFHRALAEANGWRAMGRVLELTRNGRLIAVFEKTAL